MPVEALELLNGKGSAERALTAALASFQEQVQAVSSLDLAAVVEAARPAFASGIAFSAQLVDIRGRHKLRVTVMHAGGAEVSSEEWADEVDDLLQASGWMLAMLLGIPLAQQAQPVEPENCERIKLATAGIAESSAQLSPDKQEGPAPAVDLDVALEPLTPQEIEATHQRILALPQAARQELTKAFREHFQVPRNARSIGDRITQHQHAALIDRFLEELDGAQAPADP
ncbi:MAG: hypothetical protein DCF23_06030 [Cyanobium sp.]|nr:MAG: hypothetical protein DCF23_06030 [Cyanobium sp.]